MSANPVKGETSVVIDGVEYKLRFTMEAMVQMSRRCGGKGILGIFKGLISSEDGEGPPPELMRLVFWQGLRFHHKDITEEQAGEILWSSILDGRGMEILTSALTLAFPEGKPEENPQTPSTGTGMH